MYLPDLELHECSTIEEASSLMRRFAPNARFLAGGTDVLVDLKIGRGAAPHVILLRRIPSLRGISKNGDGLRIAALTTITELNRSALVKKHAAPLLDASRRMAAPPIRNVATIGGNVASAVPCADLPPILISLGAEVETSSEGQSRRIPLHGLFIGPRQTRLQRDEILAAVVVPYLPNGFGAAYERFSLREGNAIAVASVASSLQLKADGTIERASLVLGAVAPLPKQVEGAIESLVGRKPDPDGFREAARLAKEAAEPITDVRGTARFRRDLVEVLAQRALTNAASRAKGSSHAHV